MSDENRMRVIRVVDLVFHLYIHLIWNFWDSGVDHLHIKRSSMAKHAHIGVFAPSCNKFVIIASKILFEWFTNALRYRKFR